MIQYTDLVNADPRVFHDLADQWDSLADNIQAHHGQWRSQVVGGITGGSWTGPANYAATQSVTRTDQTFATHAPNLQQVSSTLRQSATNFAEAQSRVAAMRQQAARLGLDIDATGAVSVDPGRLSADLTELPTTMAAAQAIGHEITGAVTSANSADQQAANALAALTPHTSASTTPQAAAGKTPAPQPAIGRPILGPSTGLPPGAPKPGSDPKLVKKWWDSLTPAEQQQDASSYPTYLGSTDGIPATVRDAANRTLLAQADEQLTAEYRDPHFQGDKDALKKRLIGIHDIETRLSGHAVTGQIDPRDPTRHLPGKAESGQQFLLGFSAAGQGRAIISTGNPDTATNITTTVPGVGRGLNDVLYQDLSNNDATAAGIQDAGGQPGRSAEIMWVGYDAPGSIVPPPNLDDAKAAAPALDSFQQGLVATHQGAPAHMTVVGHSYGTDVVTEAATNGHKLVADDVVLIGSPGVPADHAYDITQHMIPSHPGQDRYPPTQVWASATGQDPIAHLGVLGNDPTNSSFGADPFASDPRGDHGGYWEGVGQYNMANIELGNYQNVVFQNTNG